MKRPSPVTRPTWRTPIAVPSTHSTTTMRSVVRKGPTRVAQSKRVPGPRRSGPTKVIDTASTIQVAWAPRSASSDQTAGGGASITVPTADGHHGPCGPDCARLVAGHVPELAGGSLGGYDVDADAGAELEAGAGRDVGQDVHVPVERPILAVRGRVDDEVVGDVAEHLAQPHQHVAQEATDGGEVGRRGPFQVADGLAGHDEELVGRAAPVRAQRDRPVVRRHDQLVTVLLGLQGGGDQPAVRGAGRIRCDEPVERGELLLQLAGTNGMPSSWPCGCSIEAPASRPWFTITWV